MPKEGKGKDADNPIDRSAREVATLDLIDQMAKQERTNESENCGNALGQHDQEEAPTVAEDVAKRNRSSGRNVGNGKWGRHYSTPLSTVDR